MESNRVDFIHGIGWLYHEHLFCAILVKSRRPLNRIMCVYICGNPWHENKFKQPKHTKKYHDINKANLLWLSTLLPYCQPCYQDWFNNWLSQYKILLCKKFHWCFPIQHLWWRLCKEMSLVDQICATTCNHFIICQPCYQDVNSVTNINFYFKWNFGKCVKSIDFCTRISWGSYNKHLSSDLLQNSV